VEGSYTILIAPTGFDSLDKIRDKKVRNEIWKSIDGLEKNPESQGKALVDPFEGVRSLKAFRGRFRILYQIDPEVRAVSVLLVGERKAGKESDIYALARKLLKTLLGREEN
jgi:mRNA-degrading endonuclease RelE of RelBE toxin-antitoxin system